MKEFIFDRLLEKHELCNMEREIAFLEESIGKKQKVVVYGPRNFGKTSIIKNIIAKSFVKNKKESFVFFCDLMEVKDIESITNRLLVSFERSFEKSFPIKELLETSKRFLTSLMPEISIDPITGTPSLSLTVIHKKNKISVQELFEQIRNMSDKIPALVILDEFQDIANIKEAQSIFRNAFQEITNIPIIISGSKKHLLANIFAKPQAPLAFSGIDLEIKPISYEKYHRYIVERFEQKKISVKAEITKHIQDLMLRIPESVNMLCHNISELFSNIEINNDDVIKALYDLLNKKESRYESYISNFSITEEKVLTQIAKNVSIKNPSSKEFMKQTDLTNRSTSKIIEKLTNSGVIEKTENGEYRLSDPLLMYFLRQYR